MLTLKHRIAIPCQPIFEVIESRHNSVDNFCKQLLAIGLEEFLEIFFSKIIFIAVLIRNVSFTAIVDGRHRSVGDITMLSSISGSGSADVKNL